MARYTIPVLVLAALAGGSPAAGPAIRMNAGRFEVVGLDAAELRRLKATDLTPADWQALFAVYVVSDRGTPDREQPAVLGSYRVEDGVLRFAPRFPLVRGVRYQAVFRPSRLPGRSGGADVRAEFELPRAKPAVATAVTHVYPTRDRLPENLLKFYLHFSAPMSKGEAYRHIRLLDATGKAVDMPFLELDEELWDPGGTRLTLFFDPGRIKRGLKPREEVGPVLEEGRSYTLVINEKWADAEGNPLKETYRKSFRAVAPDDTPPDPKEWKIEPPPSGSTGALTVTFPEPLDHALLQRLLWVTDANGNRVTGTSRVTDEETRWHFTPERPWQAGGYDLVVDTTLEDLAGNSIGRPFEVDLFRPVRRTLGAATVKRPFRVR
jgi:hypothetical protein